MWDILKKYPDKELIFKVPEHEIANEFKEYIANSFIKNDIKNKFEYIIT